MSHNITIEGGTSVRLPTAGKYCDRDIVVTATGGGGGDSDELAELLANELTSLDSNATSVRQYTFRGATVLASVNLPKATSIGDSAFYGCTKLKSVNMPLVESIKTYAFYGCAKLESINMPLVESIGSYALGGCSILPTIVLPSLTTGASNMLRYCNKLSTIDLPVILNIVASMFADCPILTALILRSPTMCTLAKTTAFSNCHHFHGTVNSVYNPDGLKDGYIYVPSALIDSYKTATNWSTFSTQFRAIEDYPEICGG